MNQVKSLNKLYGDLIHPGQQLTVPDTETAVKAPAEADIAADAPQDKPEPGSELYVVQAGDTLYQISQDYDISADVIMAANYLSSPLIYPGQSLQIPIVSNSADPKHPTIDNTVSSRGSSRSSISIVEIAARYQNCPYTYGGSGPTSFDCSGFTAYVFAQTGIQLPHNAAAQYKFGQPVAKNDLQPGDLVFFGYYGSASIQHVGIYTGDNNFIHASSGQGKVVTSSLADNYYQNNYKGARRL